MKKIIFFDIDGVLTDQNYNLDPNKIELLNKICSETGADLIMSSDWRYDFDYSCKKLQKLGLTANIIGHTILSIFLPFSLTREGEIRHYLADNFEDDITYHVIDDLSLQGFGEAFTQVSENGLTEKDCKKIINYFNTKY